MQALQLQSYQYQSLYLEFYAPDPLVVQEEYEALKKEYAEAPFPFWTKVWPAAKAMTRFLLTHPEYIAGKRVMEMAAGLGLPSLVAARCAAQVECSDYLPEAVAVIRRSVVHNGLHNVNCLVRDWSSLPESIETDVLILSDVNYAPEQFEALHRLFHYFLMGGTTIILTTPQRLMARPFLAGISPWIVLKEEIIIREQPVETVISVFILQIQ